MLYNTLISAPARVKSWK